MSINLSDFDPDRRATLRRLGVVGRKINRLAAQLDDLYAERADLYAVGRDLDPPIPFAVLAEASESTEAAVTQAVRKVRLARQADND